MRSTGANKSLSLSPGAVISLPHYLSPRMQMWQGVEFLHEYAMKTKPVRRREALKAGKEKRQLLRSVGMLQRIEQQRHRVANSTHYTFFATHYRLRSAC